MKDFSFLHAADLHLGSPFRGLALKDRTVAGRFAEASRRAFSELVGQAIARDVAFVVIAGDVYDGDWKDNSIGLFFNREIARLEQAGIPLFLLRGNHDAESVITRSVALPPTVRHFSTRSPSTFKIEHLKVALHGQGFAERAMSENLAMAYPAPLPGWFNIGVLHTSLTGRPNHAPYAPATPEQLSSRGYDYWALGHVHDFEEVSREPAIVYPGNLQGRSVRECGEKGAVVASVSGGRLSAIERIVVDHARWHVLDIDLSGLREESELTAAVSRALVPVALAAGERLVALRLRLSGETVLHGALAARREQMRDDIQAACHHAGGDIWLEKLECATRPLAIAGIAGADAPAFDLRGVLDLAEADPSLREAALGLLRDVANKMPGGIAIGEDALDKELDLLLVEARDLLLARAEDAA